MSIKTKEPGTGGEQMKPPGHALLEKMNNHHKDMLEGVASELPMVEVPEKVEGIKKFCGMAHKGMEELIGTHGKGYGLKTAAMPDSLAMPGEEETTEKKKGEEGEAKPNPENTDADDLGDELPTEEIEDEEMSEDEEKAWEAQVKALEDQEKAEEEMLAGAGLLNTK